MYVYFLFCWYTLLHMLNMRLLHLLPLIALLSYAIDYIRWYIRHWWRIDICCYIQPLHVMHITPHDTAMLHYGLRPCCYYTLLYYAAAPHAACRWYAASLRHYATAAFLSAYARHITYCRYVAVLPLRCHYHDADTWPPCWALLHTQSSRLPPSSLSSSPSDSAVTSSSPHQEYQSSPRHIIIYHHHSPFHTPVD